MIKPSSGCSQAGRLLSEARGTCSSKSTQGHLVLSAYRCCPRCCSCCACCAQVIIPCYKEPLDVISKTVMAALYASIPAGCVRTGVCALREGVQKRRCCKL